MSESLTPERISEIKSLLRYETSISFHSARAKKSMLLLVAEVERLSRDITEQVRYAAALEARVCDCRPECEDGEYLHESSCPVVEIQMQSLACPGFEGNPVAPDMCAGCHESSDRHASGGAS